MATCLLWKIKWEIFFRAQAEGGAEPFQSWVEMQGWGVQEVSSGWLASAASTCISLWHGEAQDRASLIAVVEAILCVQEVTKSPVFFLSFFVDIGSLFCQDLLTPSTSGTLQVPADVYPLPSKPWKMNFPFPWRKTRLWPSACAPCSYFLPFPTADDCDTYCFSLFPAMAKGTTSHGGHLLSSPIPTALHVSPKSA